MARWTTPERATVVANDAPRRKRRSYMYNELYRGIASLPPESHEAFLAGFRLNNPEYPYPPQRCPCTRCIARR
jgi:hypothetical protein